MARKKRTLTVADGRRLTRNLMGIVVGPFRIANLTEGEIYVGKEDGEAGTFLESKLLPYLRDFWSKEF